MTLIRTLLLKVWSPVSSTVYSLLLVPSSWRLLVGLVSVVKYRYLKGVPLVGRFILPRFVQPKLESVTLQTQDYSYIHWNISNPIFIWIKRGDVRSKIHKLSHHSDLSHLKFRRGETAASVFKLILHNRFFPNGLYSSDGFSFWPLITDIATKVPMSHGFSHVLHGQMKEQTSKSII